MKRTLIIASLALATVASAQLAGTLPPPTPGTDVPPVVRLMSPGPGMIFVAPATVRLVAQAYDYDGRVVSVEFFAGDTSLGVVPAPTVEPPPTGTQQRGGTVVAPAPFWLAWSNVAVGTYRLSAVATDDDGLIRRSDPVDIVVRESLTNRPPEVPVITVIAADAWASENPDAASRNATFVVRRSGPTNAALTVALAISGTASNGVDYAEIPASVTIDAGKREATVVIEPIDDTEVERVETVMLAVPPPVMPAVTTAVYPPPVPPYKPGPMNRAVAYINDNDRPDNYPPVVKLVVPFNGARFPVNADIPLRADAADRDGRIVTVEFFSGDTLLGVSTNRPYGLRWEDVPQGQYTLTAKATDDKGGTAVSNPVRINVGQISLPPPPPPRTTTTVTPTRTYAR